MSDPNFETGFPKPSLDNPILFGKYADAIAARLRLQYSPSAGYRVVIEKEEKNPKKRRWDINVHRGLCAGAQVKIKPLSDTPHRANVEVVWHTRLIDIMAKTFTVLSLPFFILLFLAFAFTTRLGFALILTVILWFAWALLGSIVMVLIAKLCSAAFGNEFDQNRRSTMAQDIKNVPLPQQPAPGL
jgi:hypothetical protein